MAGEGGGTKPSGHGEEKPSAEHQQDQVGKPETEVRRLRSLLESVSHDLAKVVQYTPPGGGVEGLRTELSTVQQKLAQGLERPGEAKPSWREAHKARRGKERTWPKRHEGQGGPWPGSPKGCAGITECAQQEGLVPVQKTNFLQILQTYLAGVGWAEYYGGLAAALEGFFGSDGAFAHNRTSFVEFLDEVEDVLEDLAELQGGSDEALDDFEEVVLRQLRAAPGGR
uniref:Uncharacterized protein n=1 Tax=Sphaerodactylus townsendi TaxID=933632 RepID=A0ACB8G7R6_9SAUR